MNVWEGIDDRPPVLRNFTPEEEKRILEESKILREKRARQLELEKKQNQ